MKGLKIYLPDSLDEESRGLAAKRFGLRRGSLSKAVQEALTQWVKRESKIESKLNSMTMVAKNDGHAIAVIVFGSYARGDPSYNDVDIAIVFDGGGDTLSALAKYSDLVTDKLGNPDALFDLSAFGDLPLYMRQRIIREGKAVYVGNEPEFYRLAVKTALDWSDFKPIFEEAVAA